METEKETSRFSVHSELEDMMSTLNYTLEHTTTSSITISLFTYPFLGETQGTAGSTGIHETFFTNPLQAKHWHRLM